MAQPVLTVENLETHLYSREGIVKPVNDVSFTVSQGETLGIVGESGCGKTMTALSIMGLVPNPPGRWLRLGLCAGPKACLRLSAMRLSHW